MLVRPMSKKDCSVWPARASRWDWASRGSGRTRASRLAYLTVLIRAQFGTETAAQRRSVTTTPPPVHRGGHPEGDAGLAPDRRKERGHIFGVAVIHRLQPQREHCDGEGIHRLARATASGQCAVRGEPCARRVIELCE